MGLNKIKSKQPAATITAASGPLRFKYNWVYTLYDGKLHYHYVFVPCFLYQFG